MLSIFGKRRFLDCDGVTRRQFMHVGALGFGALSLSQLLAARTAAAAQGADVNDTSVVWLWLSGGPTHVETFDPKMTAPSEYHSTTGECKTPIKGITVGGTLPKIASVVDKMALVRSFHHKNSGHGGGTHWLMTGYDNRTADNGGVPNRPSMGSILSRIRGSNHPVTGMPTYIGMNRIQADGPAFLGAPYAPFSPTGSAKNNMTLGVDMDRLADRKQMLSAFDHLKREADATGQLEGVDGFQQQAFEVLTGAASKAFDLKHEDPKLVARYGKGLGEQMLLARRLCETGAGFVTISYGGWDMHGNIANAMKSRSPQIDQAVSAFVEDVYNRSLTKKILLVITGEFGRTPKVNKNGGRDHWAPLSTLALSGGGLKMGQTIGQSAAKVDVPADRPVSPQDLMATVFHVMGIPRDQQFKDNFGRPVYMLDKGKPIEELV
ncbi:MAG: DUF1501 domain-containing protein [Phycisphaeraceae bacterium]